MPTNLLSLPSELLLHTANYLPPSSVLALRLVNKHLCAAIEKAFNTLCLAEVTFPFTAYGLRSLVHFSRSPLAQHVKVLLLRIDGVYTHLQIKSVLNQIHLSEALAHLRRRYASLSVGVKFDPKGTIIPEIRASGAKMAVLTNIKHVFTEFLLPAVCCLWASPSRHFTLTSQSKSLHEEGLRASNPMITWLHARCVASAAVTWDMLVRYQHSKDDMTTPCNYIHFARGATLTNRQLHICSLQGYLAFPHPQTTTPPSSSTMAKSLNDNKKEAIASLASPTLYPPPLSTRYKKTKKFNDDDRTPNIIRRPVDTTLQQPSVTPPEWLARAHEETDTLGKRVGRWDP
ncbi:hypothetical protein KCU93_g4961, partial [Aureobasidium melanogenum]